MRFQRWVVLLVVLVACQVMWITPAGAQNTGLTARQVVERIQKNVGVPWQAQTVDDFKAGNPDTRVTGVATTMMATLDMLRRAAASGKNLIITHEPTFYDHLDKAPDLEKSNDAVMAEKKAFIEKNGLVVWRFHDHWHRRQPDGVIQGVVRQIGWEKFQNPKEQALFVLPETTVDRLAADLKKRFNAGAVRVVGDPHMKLTKAGLMPGAASSISQMRALESDDVEVLVIGETREWETVEYVRDAAAEGRRKALIIIGHVRSEQPGMEECARWLKTFLTEVPVEFIPASEPYWLAR